MKTFTEIKQLAARTDWKTVGELAGCSAKNVKLVVNEQRPDNYGIQKIFSDLLINRTAIVRRYSKTKGRVAA